jgi:hypothetical protein
MREPSLEGLLHQLTDVVAAMSASEERWLSYVRHVRANCEAKVGGDRRSAISGSAPVVAPPPNPPVNEVVDGRTTADVRGVPAATAQPAMQTDWPAASDRSPGISTGDNRNYNYFAELDEKLARLRQRTVDAGRS